MILKRYKVDSILVTQKDYVKIKEFNIPISLMKLNLKIKSDIFFEIENYIKDFYAKKD
ncbi:MAG: hypothetical protein GXO02_05810 [Epsilonproteobacteria bacterium]|nr:hypothetical protein [Campylobacterota bacterium]